MPRLILNVAPDTVDTQGTNYERVKMKDSKTIIGFCVLMAFLSMPLALLINPMVSYDQFTGYEAEFIGQETAQVGELCRFLAEGEIVRWECLPHTSDSESYGAHNENYVVSFRTPGVYTVIAAIYKDGELTIHTQPVTVDGVTPVDPIDPTNPTDPVKVDGELVGKVVGWVKKYNVEPKVCIALASNFSQVASEIAAGKLTTTGAIISRTAEMNQDLTLNENLMGELQAYLTSQADLGNLKSPEQHLVAWNSIAKGLMDASKN